MDSRKHTPRHESDLAWRLVSELAPALSADDSTAVYVELGAGETWFAVHRLLDIAVHNKLSLPAGLIADLLIWLDGYAGRTEEPLVRGLLSRVRVHPIG